MYHLHVVNYWVTEIFLNGHWKAIECINWLNVETARLLEPYMFAASAKSYSCKNIKDLWIAFQRNGTMIAKRLLTGDWKKPEQYLKGDWMVAKMWLKDNWIIVEW